MRYIAKADGPIKELKELRAPMDEILDFFVKQKEELARYKSKYGELDA